LRHGQITSNHVRIWGKVKAGAFFPQPDVHVPQKEMGSHTHQHMMMPAGIFAHFIVIHAQFGFRFFVTWLDRPTYPT
jgi:hypothetical protein